MSIAYLSIHKLYLSLLSLSPSLPVSFSLFFSPLSLSLPTFFIPTLFLFLFIYSFIKFFFMSSPERCGSYPIVCRFVFLYPPVFVSERLCVLLEHTSFTHEYLLDSCVFKFFLHHSFHLFYPSLHSHEKYSH